MADAGILVDGKEYFSRVNFALTDCGRTALLHLLHKRVGELTPKEHQAQPWSLDEFLNHNMTDILISIGKDRGKKDILYPFKQDTDLTKWDIPLFVFVLLNACELDDSDFLHRQLRHDICNLRDLRNKLLHKGTPVLDEPIYQTYIGRIVGAVQRFCDYMQEPELKESLLKDLKKYKSLTHVYQNGLISDLGSKSVDIINEADSAVENGFQQMQMIIQKKGLSVNIPVLDVIVMFRNYNKEEEMAITERLLGKFSEALEHDKECSAYRNADEVYVEVKSLVRKLFDEKKEITKVKSGCLVLSIQCHTIEAIISLVQDSLSGKLWSIFEPLEELMRTYEEHALFEVCVGITKQSCWALFNEMFCQVSDLCELHSYTVDSTAQDGGIVVRIQRFLQSFTEKENFENSFYSKEKQDIYKKTEEKFALDLEQPGMEMVIMSPKKPEAQGEVEEKTTVSAPKKTIDIFSGDGRDYPPITEPKTPINTMDQMKNPVTYDGLRKDLEYAQQEIERNVYDELDNSSISTRDSNQIDAIPGFADYRTKPCKKTFKDPDYAYSKGIIRDTESHGLMICIPKEVITKFVKQDDGKNIHVRSLIGVCQLINVQVGEDLPENRVWVEMTAKREPTEHQYSSTMSMGTVQSAQYARGQIYRTENELTRRSPVQHSDDNKDQTLKFEYVAPAGSIIVDDILKHQKVADFLLDKTNNFDLKLTQWEYDYQAPVLLERFLWYHKDIDHREAKQRLNGKEVGTFLVRQAAQATADPNHKFTMEIVRKDKKIIRLRIIHREGLYNFEDSKKEGVVDVWKLIVQAIERGLDISKPGEDWKRITAIPLSRAS